MSIQNALRKMKENLVLFLLPAEQNDYRARIFTGGFLIGFFFFVVILKMGFALFLYSFSNNRFFADITKTALVDLANAERAKYNLPALAENPVLDQAAYMKALDMFKKGYFSHVSPAGTTPWHWFDQAGYSYKYAGENLAIGFLDSKEVQNAWAASPTHEANIVNAKYKDIGIAVLKANFQGNPATIVVQLFGSKPGKPGVAAKTAPNRTVTASGVNGAAAGAAGKGVMGASTVAADEQSPGFKLMSFLALKYFGAAQAVIYASLASIIFLLILNFALKADLNHADLLLKALGFITIMALFALIDRDSVVALIPHALSIQ